MEEYPDFSMVGEEWSYNPLITSYWQKGKVNHDGYTSCLSTVMDFSMQSALVEALKTKNKDLADSVIAGDDKIDEMQVIIEDKTVELIALQQPIAKDLRILSTAMKMTTDLERIGDHAKKIAKIANRIGQDPLIKPLVDIPIAAQMVQEMVKKVLKSYIELDVNAAAEVCIADDKVDEICDTCKRDILFYMMKDQANIEQGLDLNKVVQRIKMPLEAKIE